MATDWLDRPTRPIRSFGAPLALSLAVHGLGLLVLATVSLHMVAPPMPLIVVTIREPVAPPPPLGEPAAAVAPAAIPQPMAAPQPRPAVAKPRPKIARKPPPASAPAVAPEPAPAPVEASSGAMPGVAAGAVGGVAGGQIGGAVGGHGDRIWHADEVAAQPEVISRLMPIYPPVARARGIEGLVVLEGIVDRTGHIEADGVKVLQSIPLLDDAAVAAFRQWRFKPARDQHGEPVRVVLQVPIRFQLR